MFLTLHTFKNDSCPLQIRPFSRWPPKNKMADTSHEDVCSNLVISQFLFIIEQQTYYQIEAAGPRSAVGNVSGYRCVSDCRSRGREFDPGPVPYFRGD